MKNESSKTWRIIGVMALAVVIALGTAVAVDQAKTREQSRQVAAENAVAKSLVDDAESILALIRERSVRKYAVGLDEANLAAKTRTGETALAASEFEDSKKLAAENEISIGTAMKVLVDKERNFERSYPSTKGPKQHSISDDLKGFMAYSDKVVFSLLLHRQYESSQSPMQQPLFDEYLKLSRKVTLAEVRNGKYESGVLSDLNAYQVKQQEEREQKAAGPSAKDRAFDEAMKEILK